MLGIDLSSNNEVHTLRPAYLAGVRFAWIKATEGDTYVNPVRHEHAQLAENAGMRVGYYHFAKPSPGSAPSQAAHFCKSFGNVGRRDLRPVLDLEDYGHNLSRQAVGEWAHSFVATVRKATGVCPIVYSYGPFLTSLGLARPIGCGLWLAAYSADDGHEHPFDVPHPWRHAVAHQFTDRGRLAGIGGAVDLTHAARLRPLLAHPVSGRL